MRNYGESGVGMATGSCRAALGLDGRGRLSPHGQRKIVFEAFTEN
jgi:hypothetical protein